jgi:hypothetical protein
VATHVDTSGHETAEKVKIGGAASFTTQVLPFVVPTTSAFPLTFPTAMQTVVLLQETLTSATVPAGDVCADQVTPLVVLKICDPWIAVQ